jgi:hypothetical protein
MKSMLKKILFSFLVFLTLITSSFSLLAPRVHAQETWYEQSFPNWFTKVYSSNTPPSEIFGERYTAAQVQWVIYGLFAQIFNIDSSGNVRKAVLCAMTGDLGSAECVNSLKVLFEGLSSIVYKTDNTSLLAAVFADRPLSGVTYLKQTAMNLKIIPEVKAQGFGFTAALDPILVLWRACRDISYALLVLAIIVLAFMIMFRVKIAPQVVISVQSALPKVAITLILITFSYAIAGFMVDLMYVVIGLLSLAFAQVPNAGSPGAIFNWMTKGPSVAGIANSGVVGILVSYIWGFIGATAVAFFTSSGILGLVVGFFLGIIAAIILILVAIFLAFKICWMLFKAFATTLLLAIIAPLQIMLGTIVPGMGFGAWLKSFIANLAIFPVTGLLLKLAIIFLDATRAPLHIQVGTTPLMSFGAFNQSGWPPLLGGSENIIGLALLGTSLVILSLVPKTAEVIQGLITGRPFAYGTAMGEAMGPINWAGGQARGPLTSEAAYQLNQRLLQPNLTTSSLAQRAQEYLRRNRSIT